MAVILIILAIVFFFIMISLHNSADKQKAEFNNRPSIITSPANDLFTNQKYAIINILAFALWTNPISAYSDEANEILKQWSSKLGLSEEDMMKSVRISMSNPPERSIQTIRASLIEIRDKTFIRSVYRDVERIAQISGDQDTIEFIKELFDDIFTHWKSLWFSSVIRQLWQSAIKKRTLSALAISALSFVCYGGPKTSDYADPYTSNGFIFYLIRRNK